MSRFFETIRFQHGEFSLLDYHQERFDRTRFEKLGLKKSVNILSGVHEVPQDDDLYRFRLSYDQGSISSGFYKYELKAHQKVKIVPVGNFDYSYKSEDRSFFDQHLLNSQADDVLFIKDGFLTDCTYSNLALFDGERWFTPEHKLLSGVKRQFLIDQNFLKVKPINVEEIAKFSKIAFLNAMRDFELVYDFELLADEIHLTLFNENTDPPIVAF